MNHSKSIVAVFLGLSVTLMSGCDNLNATIQTPKPAAEANPATPAPSKNVPAAKPPQQTTIAPTPITPATDALREIDSEPDSLIVLVNKQHRLPNNFKPSDLVDPNVPFIFSGKSEKRLMRKEAADALEKMFAGAKKDGLELAGVSAYRSESTQRVLFDNYAKKDGEAAARKYSALPGTSEHETGLAIDVSGIKGACAAQDCFGDTKEAAWLAQHATEYGFILRYPKGKEDSTGYQYEPWHLRYVGRNVAAEINKSGLTMEEFYNDVPATGTAKK